MDVHLLKTEVRDAYYTVDAAMAGWQNNILLQYSGQWMGSLTGTKYLS